MTEQTITLFLGETIGFWVQTGAIVLSALFAGRQIRLLRKQEKSDDFKRKQRATIDAVISDRRDDGLTLSRQQFGDMKAQGENFESLGAHPIIDNKEKNQAILDILNNYEFMAAGIKEQAFDEEIFKRMKCSLIVQDWDVLEVYIRALRKKSGRPKLFVEFEWLAEKWKDDSSLRIKH